MIANAIAAMLIHLEKRTQRVPHAYFEWTEGDPVGNLFRFMMLGEGDVAPIVHEVLRRAIPDVKHRPVIQSLEMSKINDSPRTMFGCTIL